MAATLSSAVDQLVSQFQLNPTLSVRGSGMAFQWRDDTAQPLCGQAACPHTRPPVSDDLAQRIESQRSAGDDLVLPELGNGDTVRLL